MKKIIVLFFAFSALTFVACDDHNDSNMEDDMEEVGEDIDDDVEEMGDEMEEAGEEMEDEMDN